MFEIINLMPFKAKKSNFFKLVHNLFEIVTLVLEVLCQWSFNFQKKFNKTAIDRDTKGSNQNSQKPEAPQISLFQIF